MSTREVNDALPTRMRWLVVVALLSLGAAFYLLVSPGGTSPRRSVGADSYSRSAIGHFGLVALLREEGEAVLQRRLDRELSQCGLLVVAEPHAVDDEEDRRLGEWVASAPATLVVLPKREGIIDATKPQWIERVELLPLAEITDLLTHIGRWADASVPAVERFEQVEGWRLPSGWRPPQLTSPVQLLTRDRDHIEPLIVCNQGVLLGRIGDVWVLSDPDLIANHGLHQGDNAALALAILRRFREPGAIVFDETLHGHRLAPSIWQAAAQFPFVLVTVHLLLLTALLLWIANGRFGPVVTVPPPIAAGKQFLIDNVAALLRRAGSYAPSLRRYVRQRVRQAAEALRAPRGLSDEECRRFVLARMQDAERRRELEELLLRHTTIGSVSEALAVARRLRTLTEEAHVGR